MAAHPRFLRTLVLLLSGSFVAVSAVQASSAGADDAARLPEARPMPVGTRKIAPNINGCVEAFVRNSDGSLWRNNQRETGSNYWGDWKRLPGTAATDPVVATNIDGRLQLFVVRGDKKVYTLTAEKEVTSNCATKWTSSWAVLGGNAVGGPAVATNLEGRLQVFVVDENGNLKSRTRMAGSEVGEKWESSWTSIGSPSGCKVLGTPAVVMHTPGRLQLFVRCSDRRVWHSTQKAPSSKEWGRWNPINGLNTVASDPAVGKNKDGRRQVFVRDSNGKLWTVARKRDETGWRAWQNMGLDITGTPAVAQNANGRLEVFARRAGDKTLSHIVQIEPNHVGAWQKLKSLGGTVNGVPAVVTNSDGRLEVLVSHEDGTVHHRAQNTPGATGDDWTHWGDLGHGGRPCLGSGSLACVNVVNKRTGHVLAPEVAGSDKIIAGRVPGADASDRWSLGARRTDGSFTLINRSSHQCLDVDRSWYDLARRWDCKGTKTSQRWFLEPVGAPVEGTYLIRQVDTNQCLAQKTYYDPELGEELPNYDEVIATACDGENLYHQWMLGMSGGRAPGTKQLAVRYAMATCANTYDADDPSSNSCDFAIAGDQGLAYYDQRTCIPGSLVVNGSSSPLNGRIEVSDTSGHSSTWGGSYTVSGSIGMSEGLLSAEIGFALEAHHEEAWFDEDSVFIGIPSVRLQPGEYAWLEKSLVTKKAIGKWVFTGANKWEETGQSAIHASKTPVDGLQQGTTVLRRSKTPPAHC